MPRKLLPAAGWGGEREKEGGGGGEREKEKDGGRKERKSGPFTAGRVLASSFDLFSEFTPHSHGEVS